MSSVIFLASAKTLKYFLYKTNHCLSAFPGDKLLLQKDLHFQHLILFHKLDFGDQF